MENNWTDGDFSHWGLPNVRLGGISEWEHGLYTKLINNWLEDGYTGAWFIYIYEDFSP